MNDIRSKENEIQCIVSHIPSVPNCLNFGTTQFPGLSDYADSIDTMKFLLELSEARL